VAPPSSDLNPLSSRRRVRSPSRGTIASAQRLPVRLNALFARRSKEPANASLASFASFPFLKGFFPRMRLLKGRLVLLNRAIIFAPMRHREKARARSPKRPELQCNRSKARRDGFARICRYSRGTARRRRSLNRESATRLDCTRLHATVLADE